MELISPHISYHAALPPKLQYTLVEQFLFTPIEAIRFNAQSAAGAPFALEYLWNSCCASSAVYASAQTWTHWAWTGL